MVSRIVSSRYPRDKTFTVYRKPSYLGFTLISTDIEKLQRKERIDAYPKLTIYSTGQKYGLTFFRFLKLL